MSMDSNSFSVLSDNQKVYKSTGVSVRMPQKGITCKRLAARWFACGHTDMRAWKHARTAILEHAYLNKV